MAMFRRGPANTGDNPYAMQAFQQGNAIGSPQGIAPAFGGGGGMPSTTPQSWGTAKTPDPALSDEISDIEGQQRSDLSSQTDNIGAAQRAKDFYSSLYHNALNNPDQFGGSASYGGGGGAYKNRYGGGFLDAYLKLTNGLGSGNRQMQYWNNVSNLFEKSNAPLPQIGYTPQAGLRDMRRRLENPDINSRRSFGGAS